MRKSIKWYKKLAFHFIDLILLNSLSMYKIKTGKHTPLADFQLSLIHQLIEKFHVPAVRPRGGRPSAVDTPIRLTARHSPSIIPSKRRKVLQVCIMCSKGKEKKRKESRYMCSVCNVGLCVVPCFEVYHAQRQY